MAQEDQRIAYHEAGHVLAAYLAFDPDQNPLKSVSVCPVEGFQGHVSWADDFDDSPANQVLTERAIRVLLGGATAEKLVFGNSKGEKTDLADAKNRLQGAGWIADT